jgi:hypothetical protein
VEQPQGNKQTLVKCKHCGHTFKVTSATRIREHLLAITGNVAACNRLTASRASDLVYVFSNTRVLRRAAAGAATQAVPWEVETESEPDEDDRVEA